MGVIGAVHLLQTRTELGCLGLVSFHLQSIAPPKIVISVYSGGSKSRTVSKEES